LPARGEADQTLVARLATRALAALWAERLRGTGHQNSPETTTPPAPTVLTQRPALNGPAMRRSTLAPITSGPVSGTAGVTNDAPTVAETRQSGRRVTVRSTSRYSTRVTVSVCVPAL